MRITITTYATRMRNIRVPTPSDQRKSPLPRRGLILQCLYPVRRRLLRSVHRRARRARGGPSHLRPALALPFADFACLRTLAFDPTDWFTLRIGSGSPSRALIDFLIPILDAPNLDCIVLRFKIDKFEFRMLEDNVPIVFDWETLDARLSGKETLRKVVFRMNFEEVRPKLAREKLEDVRVCILEKMPRSVERGILRIEGEEEATGT